MRFKVGDILKYKIRRSDGLTYTVLKVYESASRYDLRNNVTGRMVRSIGAFHLNALYKRQNVRW